MEINANILKNFIVKTIGADKLAKGQAQNYGIDADKYAETDVDENGYLELDEILKDEDLYQLFATKYTEEQNAKQNDIKDKDKEKEEETKVKDKNDTGV